MPWRVLHEGWTDPAAIALFVLLARAPGFFPSSLGWDESCYILMAREMLTGHLPYVTMFLEKPLGAPILFAVAMGLFGQSVLVARLLGLVCVLATCLILCAIARVAGQSRAAALATALLYAAFSTQLDGLGTNIELLTSPFTAGALLIIVRLREATGMRSRIWMILASGALFGMAIQLKYLPTIPAATMFCVLVIDWVAQKTFSVRATAILGALFVTVCWLPAAIGAVAYWWLGHLDEFLLCNFGFMSSYIDVKQPENMEAYRVAYCMLTVVPLVVLSSLALRTNRRFLVIVVAWLISEIAALIAPWKFWDHYFLLLLPPLCVLAGFSLDEITRIAAAAASDAMRAKLRSIVIPVVAIAVAASPLGNIGSWMIHDGFGPRQPDAPREIAAIIRSDPTPGVTAWVVNYEPVIYFLADIPIPTRFPLPASLVGGFAEYNGSHPDTEIHRILATRPRYLIVSSHWEIVQPALQPLIRSAIDGEYQLFQTIASESGPVEIYRRRT